mmetsp:Transcript_20227/g.44678  ORF Transcript_20227/g.44678 Transcript_20227/m.44678 type:complete len:144 (+) Transcript_20227:1122-1553(+)
MLPPLGAIASWVDPDAAEVSRVPDAASVERLAPTTLTPVLSQRGFRSATRGTCTSNPAALLLGDGAYVGACACQIGGAKEPTGDATATGLELGKAPLPPGRAAIPAMEATGNGGATTGCPLGLPDTLGIRGEVEQCASCACGA